MPRVSFLKVSFRATTTQKLTLCIKGDELPDEVVTTTH